MTSLFSDQPDKHPRQQQEPLEPGTGIARLQRANRSQLFWRPTNLDQTLPSDHLARVVWAAVEPLDMSEFLIDVRAVEGQQGRPAIDPHLLLAVWVYGMTQGVGSARALDRLCEEHDAYRWILGGVTVNYHTLSDFRWKQPEALEALFVRLLAALRAADLVKLQRVAQDGLRIRASAGSSSFRREGYLRECLAEAKAHVQRLKKEAEKPPANPSKRQQRAAERAARERLERVQRALAELPKVREAQKVKDPDNARTSTTDPDARIMKMGDGGYRPAFNRQCATDCASGLIVGVATRNTGSDRAQLEPMLDQIQQRYSTLPPEVLVDGGYVSSVAIEESARRKVTFYGPVQVPKRADINRYTPRKGDSGPVIAWRQRMATQQAQDIYTQRASTAEWVNAMARLHGLRNLFV